MGRIWLSASWHHCCKEMMSCLVCKMSENTEKAQDDVFKVFVFLYE